MNNTIIAITTLTALGIIVAYAAVWWWIFSGQKRAVESEPYDVLRTADTFPTEMICETSELLRIQGDVEPHDKFDPRYMPDWLRRPAKCRAIIKSSVKRASRRPFRRVR